MADESTRKRKRFSKNKKAYWKKHSEVNDVEEFLEDQRLQERTGGIVAEKTDSEIFFVDSVAKDDAQVEVPLKRRRKEPKALKCHSALLPNPKITAIKVRKNVKTRKPKKETEPVILTAGMKKSMADREYSKLTKAEQQVQKQRLEASCDLWNNTETRKLHPADGDVAPNEHYLKIMGHTRRKTPFSYKTNPSLVPAIELAHPGTSYNPEYDDHQELLQKALLIEEDKDKREKRVIRAMDDMFPSAKDAPTEDSKRDELAEGLFDESDSDEDEEEANTLAVNPPVRREDKKTEATRKKHEKQRIEKEKAEHRKSERIRKNQIFRLKSTKKELKELSAKLKDREEKKIQLAEKNKMKTKRLGKHKFEEPDLEIKLSDEIEGSLRRLKPEGHLLEDRFKSLQRRNIIEPRGRAKKLRKYKRKSFTKSSHKDVVQYNYGKKSTRLEADKGT